MSSGKLQNKGSNLKTKRICFVLRLHFGVRMGGAELQAYLLATELAKRGWDVHYVSERHGQVSKEFQNGLMSLHWLSPRKKNFAFLNYRALKRILKEIRPDICYSRIALDYTGIIAWICRKFNIKFVWASSHERDCCPGKYLKKAIKFSSEFKLRRKLFKKLLAQYADFLYSYGIKHADLVLTQSRTQQEAIRKNFGRENFCLPNGLPIRNQSEFKKQDPSLILWVANIKHFKRPGLFVKLAERCQDLKADFLIIGDSTDTKLTKEIEKYVNKIKNINYIGKQPYSRVNKFLEKASLFVNTSAKEGFPNTFIQAWIHNVPVVSMEFDPDNVLERNNIGYCPGSFDNLISIIRSLLHNPNQLQTMGRRGREYAERHHNISKNAKKFEKYILQLIK